MGLILLFVWMLAYSPYIAGSIWLIVVAFKKGLPWGLITGFGVLFPPWLSVVPIVFGLMNWKIAKGALALYLVSLVAYFCIFFGVWKALGLPSGSSGAHCW